MPAIRPVNLIGPAGATAVMVAMLAWGTPHLLLATRSSGFGSVRFYDDCAYAALSGRMTHVRGWSCPLVRLLKEGH